MDLNDNTPIAMLTVRQLKEVLKLNSNKEEITLIDHTQKKFVYGLKGIRELFQVSHATAQKYKDTVIKDAIIQHGRKIIVDADKALELFSKKDQELW